MPSAATIERALGQAADYASHRAAALNEPRLYAPYLRQPQMEWVDEWERLDAQQRRLALTLDD